MMVIVASSVGELALFVGKKDLSGYIAFFVVSWSSFTVFETCTNLDYFFVKLIFLKYF